MGALEFSLKATENAQQSDNKEDTHDVLLNDVCA